jgi:alkanesulfonate monooxygenase SsuD/methylene tetrahydromethanopterin reductase-like flavin-dependent oxidoreductase (luciferase family)
MLQERDGRWNWSAILQGTVLAAGIGILIVISLQTAKQLKAKNRAGEQNSRQAAPEESQESTCVKVNGICDCTTKEVREKAASVKIWYQDGRRVQDTAKRAKVYSKLSQAQINVLNHMKNVYETSSRLQTTGSEA